MIKTDKEAAHVKLCSLSLFASLWGVDVGPLDTGSIIRLYFLDDTPFLVCTKAEVRPELASSSTRHAHTIQTSVFFCKFNKVI